VGELGRALDEAGLTEVRVVREHDPFRGTSKERTARRYAVIGIDVSARKP